METAVGYVYWLSMRVFLGWFNFENVQRNTRFKKKFSLFFDPPLYPHPTSWKSVLILSTHLVCCAMFPLETLPLGDPSRGVVYLRIVLSQEQASRMWVFLNTSVLQGGIVSTSPNPQAGGPPLVGCPRMLIQFIFSYPPYRRPFLYPQPEDAPCRGERDPLHGRLLPLQSLKGILIWEKPSFALSVHPPRYTTWPLEILPFTWNA